MVEQLNDDRAINPIHQRQKMRHPRKSDILPPSLALH